MFDVDVCVLLLQTELDLLVGELDREGSGRVECATLARTLARNPPE